MLATSLNTDDVASFQSAIIGPLVRKCPLLLLCLMPMLCPTSGKESKGSSSWKERCATSQISARRLLDIVFQSGKPFAPFDGLSDSIWQQRLIEDSIGKGKRDRLFQTVRNPDFDPSTVAITSEAKRRKVMSKLPGPVSGDFCFSQMQ